MYVLQVIYSENTIENIISNTTNMAIYNTPQSK